MVENQEEKREENASEYIPLSEASKKTGYTPEYLNFLSRRGKLKAKKIGRNWHTTWGWVKEFAKNLGGKEVKGEAVKREREEKAKKIEEEIRLEVRREKAAKEKEREDLEREKNSQAREADAFSVARAIRAEIKKEKEKEYFEDLARKEEKNFGRIFSAAVVLAIILPLAFFIWRFKDEIIVQYEIQKNRLALLDQIPEGKIINENFSKDEDESPEGKVLGDEEILDNSVSKSENFKIKEMSFGGDVILVRSGDQGDLQISDIRSESFISGKKEEVKLAVSWKTNKMAASEIEYSKNNGQNPKSINEKNYGFTHSVIIDELEPRASYVYSIKARDRWSNETKSEIFGIYTASKPVSVFDMIADAIGEVFGWALK